MSTTSNVVTHREQSVHVLLLGIVAALSLDLLPGVPLGLSDKVHHARSRGVDVTDGSLLVEGVELKLVVLGGLDGSVLWHGLDDADGLVELSGHCE